MEQETSKGTKLTKSDSKKRRSDYIKSKSQSFENKLNFSLNEKQTTKKKSLSKSIIKEKPKDSL